MNSTEILKTRIDNVNYHETLSIIEKFIRSKKPHQICTINPEYIMTAQKDKELAYIINHSSLNTPDGSGLLFAAKYKGLKLKVKVSGIDLVYKLAYLASKKGYKIFLLGGFGKVASLSAQILKDKYPGINIVGTYEGKPQIVPISKKIWQSGYKIRRTFDISTENPLMRENNLKIIKKITSAKPHILLVAYGCPKQDKFIARFANYLNVPVMIGVGGSFDYIAGKISRAPSWMRVLRLEWFYRLLKQPKQRFNRIITAVIRFPWAVFKNSKTQK